MSKVWNSGLPLASSTWGAEERLAIESVMDSGLFTMGEHVRNAEADFAEYIGTKFSVMVNSGSSANLLAMAALNFHSSKGVEKGAEIIVPMVSWSTTYYPVNQAGYKLVFVDVADSDWNISLEAVRAAVTSSTKAIFAVNLLGAAADLPGLSSLCDEYGLLLLEDNCESLGAEVGGRKTGSFGVMGTHSTFFSHHICTMEGGFITTNDEEFYQILLSLRAHGWTRNLPTENHVFNKTGDPFLDSYTFVLPGYNVRPLEMAGAIGVQQIKKLPSFIEARIDNAEHLKNRLGNLQVKMQETNFQSSWFGFGFLLDPKSRVSRSEVLSELNKSKIDTRPIVAGNFLKNPVMKHLDFRISGQSRVADLIHEYGFFIGNHHVDIKRELDDVVEILERLGV
jgi:CDP-6-deoxy-D-xylo-4-hexulose-3-dehydrase